MKSVISASRRTDIPAFYLNWFIDNIRQGYIDVQNPMYKKQSQRVSLHPDQVGWIVFWSRNFSHFLKKRELFDAFRLFFHFTILTPSPLLEKNHALQKNAITQMTQLATHYGPQRIIWRYDPIVIWMERTTFKTNFDKENFLFLCRQFSDLGIDRCYFSFVTDYRKFKNRLAVKYPELTLVSNTHSFAKQLLSEMREISAAHRIKLFSCCNDMLIGRNTDKGCCISGTLLNQLAGKKEVSEAKAATRPFCGCTRSIDIGNYKTQPCPYGCIYCYANPIWK
jgi:hypothetical protein